MQTLERFSLKSGLGNYYKIGTGYPLVLLHGFAETYAIWQNIIPGLSSKYNLIIPHIPGCGTQQEATSTFSMEFIATFVNEILEQEAIEKTILFGHSMGGYAAMAFAEIFPQKLLGLSLVHSSAQADLE